VTSTSPTRCNSLQLTATHCNPLQLTASHCISPQHVATKSMCTKWGVYTTHTRATSSFYMYHIPTPTALQNKRPGLFCTLRTYCNTLQDNMLYHIAKYCKLFTNLEALLHTTHVLQYTARCRNRLYHTATHCKSFTHLKALLHYRPSFY